MQYEIIRDGGKLRSMTAMRSKVEVVRKQQDHILVVSAIWHVAEHGNVNVLNNLFGTFNIADQRAFRNYIRRMNVKTEVVKDGNRSRRMVVKDANGQTVTHPWAFLAMEGRKGFVIAGNNAARKEAINWCEEHITPTKEWPTLYDIDPAGEERTFQFTGFAATFKRLAKMYEDNKVEIVKASPKLAETFERFEGQFAPMLKQVEDNRDAIAEPAIDPQDVVEMIGDYVEAAGLTKVAKAEPEAEPVAVKHTPAKRINNKAA